MIYTLYAVGSFEETHRLVNAPFRNARPSPLRSAAVAQLSDVGARLLHRLFRWELPLGVY